MKITQYERISTMMPTLERDSLIPIDSILHGTMVSLQEFVDIAIDVSPDIRKILGYLKDKYGSEEMHASANSFFQAYYFWKNGKLCYNIDESVANALYFTDIRNTKANVIQLTAQSIYYTIPSKFFTITHPMSGDHRVEGINIIHRDLEDRHDFRVLMVGETKKDMHDDCLFFYRFEIKKDGKIKDSLKMVGDDKWHNETYQKQYEENVGFIINLLIYINSKEVDAPLPKIRNHIPVCETNNPKKKRRWEKQNQDLKYKSRLPFKEVKDKDLEDLFAGMSEEDLKRSGSKKGFVRFKTKWLVKGHFHTYWVGKGRTDTRVNWLVPYWKGEDRLEVKKT